MVSELIDLAQVEQQPFRDMFASGPFRTFHETMSKADCFLGEFLVLFHCRSDKAEVSEVLIDKNHDFNQ